MNEWMNEWINKWKNEWMDKWIGLEAISAHKDDSDDTALQTDDIKFEPWRSEAGHATFRS